MTTCMTNTRAPAGRGLRYFFGVMAWLVLVLPLYAGLWPHTESDLKPDSRIVWGVLDNGLRYAIMPHDEPPDRVSLRLLVQAGSLMEADDQRGLAHFIEHMAFNGTKHFEAEEMVKYFQRLGMDFGADTNAHTSYNETVYKIELPSSDGDLLNDGLKLLRDYADGMLMAQEELDKERGVILAEKRARDSVEFRTFKAAMSFLMPESLLPRRHPIGIEAVIENAPREAFLRYYRDWYRPDRMVLVAVGAVEPQSLAPLLERHFASMARAETVPTPV